MKCARGELRLCHGFELAVVWRAIELIDQMFASEEFFLLGPDDRRRLPVVDSIVDVGGPRESG